ncbi:MAG: hypothetical protein J5379_03595 [Clostridiales bacterium]|nr:hypothetical protein [Clostridiales bacterium]
MMYSLLSFHTLLNPLNYPYDYFAEKTSVRICAIMFTIGLCLIAIAAVILIFTHLLSKSNDYGDEDSSGLRKGFEDEKNIGASAGMDLAVGSFYSMKKFKYEDITKR